MKFIPDIQVSGSYGARVLTAQLREDARASQRQVANARRKAHARAEAAAKAEEEAMAAARRKARADTAYDDEKARVESLARAPSDAEAQQSTVPEHPWEKAAAADADAHPAATDASAPETPPQTCSGLAPGSDESDPKGLRAQPRLALVTPEAQSALAALQPAVPAGHRPHVVWPPRENSLETAKRVADLAGDVADATRRRSSWRVRILAGIAVAGAAMAPVMGVAAAINYPAYEALRLRHAGLPLTGGDGRQLGIVAPRDGTAVTMAGGVRMPHVYLTSRTADPQVIYALDMLEGQVKILGISPHYMLRAVVCSAADALGFANLEMLALRNGRCAGASTPEMQSSRTTRDNRAIDVGRKFVEGSDSIGMTLAKPKAEREVAVLDSLHYGQAAGFPLYGQRIASLAAFGVEPDRLPLEKKALLASFVKEPLKLICRITGLEHGDVAAFERQRKRARKALVNGFAGDPGLAAALARLDAMAPVVSPAPLAPDLMADLNAQEACQIAAHPLARGAVMAGARNLDLSQLPAADGPIAEVVLSLTEEGQRRYREEALTALDVAHGADWFANPVKGEAVTLSFDTDGDGRILHLFEGGMRGLLYQEREAASLSKVGGLLILAKANFPAEGTLCNHEAQGRQNAGGNKGFVQCAGEALESVEKVFGRSRNLPIYHELSTRFTPAQLRREANTLGFRVGSDPAADLAFGTAKISPARMTALMTAISNGVAGRPARAVMPHLADRYRDTAGWHSWPRERIDLSAYFAPPNSRALIRRGAQAPFLYNHGKQHGTLQMAIGDLPVAADEVGKSGTQDNDGSTRGKFAAGARGGRGWFTMVVAKRDDLGESSIGIWPLSRRVRSTAFAPGAGTTLAKPTSVR
jgi:hypothetical protein